MSELTLEARDQENHTPVIGPFMLTPALGENYWAYRVPLSERQAIIGFPKFGTVGIGFAVGVEDWNTNLPYTCDAKQIYEHIAHNAGDDAIGAEVCMQAIEMIRAAIYATNWHAEKMTAQGRPIDWVQPPIVFEFDDDGEGTS